MAKSTPRTNVGLGEFPFPIIDGPEESRYLTWIRNHSNYMAVRGPLDYVRAIGVLVRGVLINFLILLPYLLAVAVIVAAYHILPAMQATMLAWAFVFAAGLWVLIFPSYLLVIGLVLVALYFVPESQPFRLTVSFAFALLVWTLLFPLITFFIKIIHHRKSVETGSESSVKQRDRYERTFSGFLVAIVVIALLESLPSFLTDFHKLVHDQQFGWPAFASIGVAAAILSTAQKLLASLGGLAKKLAMLTIGLLGVLVPLTVIMIVADYLVFGLPPGDWTVPLALATLLLPLGIVAAVILGAVGGAFIKGDLYKLAATFVMSLAIVGVAFWLADVAFGKGREVGERLDRAADTLKASEYRDAVIQDMAGDETSRLVVLYKDLPNASSGIDLFPELGTGMGTLGDKLETAGHQENLHRLYAEQMKILGKLDWFAEFVTRKDAAALAQRIINEPSDSLTDMSQYSVWNWYLGESEYPFLQEHLGEEIRVAVATLSDWGHRFIGVRRDLATTASYSENLYPGFFTSLAAESVRKSAFWTKVLMVALFAGVVWLFCWFTVDVNLTSIHGLYRDRLASAFLVGVDTEGDVDIEKDLDLAEMCRHEAGSIAPYHLINAALNLQGSDSISIRDRQSDFFIFSKRYIGGRRTGYCRSENMELVFPQMDLATAMAISAAAASPNMGRATSPALVAIMTLLDIRLGYWIPNPGRLESWLCKRGTECSQNDGFSFAEVFKDELEEIKRRWSRPEVEQRELSPVAAHRERPSPEHGLIGIGFSGGGIRSASVNLGIAQALHRSGVFNHIDYMSTVSGGGYLGSSISALMRRKTRTTSETKGTARITETDDGEKIVSIASRIPPISRLSGLPTQHRFAKFANIAVQDCSKVKPGQRLLSAGATAGVGENSFGKRFYWRVRPLAFLREMSGRLDETYKWVNVSDGGHIENLAGIELLRRRCKYVIIGDGEADPNHHFNGLATLIRTARIDLGVTIDINVDKLRLVGDRLSERHWALGRIHYPPPDHETSCYLLYLKSSMTGDEDEVIQEYRHAHPTYPHESTADQSFTEGQFEAYRSLGQHIADHALQRSSDSATDMSYLSVERWFAALATARVDAAETGKKPKGGRFSRLTGRS